MNKIAVLIKKWLDAKPQQKRLRRFLLFFVYPGCILMALILWLYRYLEQPTEHLDRFYLYLVSVAVFFYFMLSSVWLSILNRIGKVVCGVALVVFSLSPIALVFYFYFTFVKPATDKTRLLKLRGVDVSGLPKLIGHPIALWGSISIDVLLVVASIIWIISTHRNESSLKT